MVPPQIPARMEKLHQFSIEGVKTSQIGSFVPIAMQTSQCQIVQFRRTPVLAWNDVIDVKRERKERGRKMTILAAAGRSLPDLPT
jgi:hypothetical protein